jgi:hypothetical protein
LPDGSTRSAQRRNRCQDGRGHRCAANVNGALAGCRVDRRAFPRSTPAGLGVLRDRPRIVQLKLNLGVRRVHLHESDFNDQIDITEAAAEGRYPLPPGYQTGYTVFYNRLLLTIDSHRDSNLHDTGVITVG